LKLANVLWCCGLILWFILAFPLGEDCKIEAKETTKRNHTMTPLPLGEKRKVGTRWPTYFIKVTMISSGNACGLLIQDKTTKLTMFWKSLFVKEVLPGVPDAPIPPKSGRFSPWLSTNLQKKANKQSQKMPKITLDKLMGQVKTYRKMLNKTSKKTSNW
jgi:hypothetical protein